MYPNDPQKLSILMSCFQKYSPIDGGRPIVKREAGIGPKLIEALRLQSGNIAGIVTYKVKKTGGQSRNI